jgi:hypothetical protein
MKYVSKYCLTKVDNDCESLSLNSLYIFSYKVDISLPQKIGKSFAFKHLIVGEVDNTKYYFLIFIKIAHVNGGPCNALI